MKNIFLTIFAIFLFISVSAQKQKATLYFKDGTVKKGLANIDGAYNRIIRFRLKEGAKLEYYNYETLKAIVIKETYGGNVRYEYIKKKKKRKPVLTIVNKEGEKEKGSATITLKDGTKLSGFAKIRDGRIKFRKEKKATKQWFDYTNTKKIVLQEYNGLKEYHYKNVDGNATIKLLELVMEGKVTLYRTHYEGNHAMMTGGGNFGGGGFSGGMMIGGGSYAIDNYYVCKDDKDVVAHLGSTHLFSKNFKKAASKFFKDCPKLVSLIQTKKYKKRDIEDIIQYYNDHCN